MSGRPGYGLPSDPRNNPFVNPPPSFPQPRKDYESDSEVGDGYGQRGTYQSASSTTHLTGQQYYDQAGQYDYREHCVLLTL